MSRYSGFEDFVAARSRALSRTAYLLTGDYQHAEDLLQEALSRAAMRWPALRAGDPEAYVRRSLYNGHVSRWRRHRGRELLTVDPVPPSVTDPAEATTVRLSMERALRQLTAKQRTVLVLRFYEDLTEVQTAEALGIGHGTVKSRTREALARLRAVAPELAGLLGEPAPTNAEATR